MISLVKCDGFCNSADDLSAKVCVPSETKGVNVKVFNMIRRINETKTLVKSISHDFKCKFDFAACNPNQNGIIKHTNANVKTMKHARKIIVGILVHVFVRMVSN